ncbi:MAG TPA: FlgO family outer membrane protein, partial [Xanthomonadales bacterium]|nr:FlgO family outer membrane protein [Xanthomonadales bacterium]
MNSGPHDNPSRSTEAGWFARLRQRGVLRVAFSYALIAWLLLQIGDVVIEPLGAPAWVMRALIVLVIAGFPVALLLAWFFELTPSGIQRDTLPEGAARPRVLGIRHYADVLIIGVLLIAVVFLLAKQEGWVDEDQGPPVIAVLPFTELGAGNDSYFGAGLSDTLIHKLGQLSQLVVLASSSTFEFHGQGLDLRAVGAKLSASSILEGTVQRAGNQLRINARLVEVKSGQQLWSGSFERPSTDLFAVQDEIAGAVSDALEVVLSPND